MMESGADADLGLESHGSIQGEGASDPHQGNGRHSTGAANGHSKMSARGKSKSPASNPRLKACRSNFTVPQPFSLTTEKRASKIHSPGPNGVTPTQTQKPATHTTKKVESPAAYQAKSHSSSLAGTTPRSKAEFVFKSDERAQKRMEFYANLTEKTKAREAERTRMQANNQQQMAAEIKKLRKDQTFKATPMPKFYQEPAPVRIDVKKTPPTRPKSPKLGRRVSAGGDAPKIIARRSSDEYDISKLPAEDLKPATPPIAGEPPKASIDEELFPVELLPEREGSEHSSSRKSDSLIPKAAVSEDEDHVSIPELLLPSSAAAIEDDHSPLESSRLLAPDSSPDEAPKGTMQLPVSSSLLDDDGEEEDGDEDEGGSEYDDDEEEEEDHGAGVELPSPRDGGDDQDDHQENVRVYISEEFRLAAAAGSTGSKDEGS